MAEMKPLAPLGSTKDAFLGTTTTAAKKAPASKRPQVKKLSDTSGRYFKIGVYGDFGTGKTFGLVDLIAVHGLKVLVVSTDVGGDGLLSVIAELRKRGRADLAETNVYHVTLSTYEEFVEFCDTPKLFFPEIYEVGLDLLAWDGFSSFQQYQVSEHVDSLGTILDREGNVITQKYWGEIKNASIKNLNRFLYMHNRQTGKLWHKYLTMLVTDSASEAALAKATTEAERQKLMKDVKTPWIQGAAAKIIGPAFDIFMRTGTRGTRKEDGTKGPAEFVYHVIPDEKQKAKLRGLEFPAVIPANMGTVWTALMNATGMQAAGNGGEIGEENA
jgi:hypothetical protein